MKRPVRGYFPNIRPILLGLLALTMVPALPGCSGDGSSIFAMEEEWEGQLKFIFVERAAVAPFYLSDSEALLLRLSDETEFIGVGELAVGDGINVANRLFHSKSTYRVRGDISENPAGPAQLLSIPTRIVDVQSIELVEKGTGDCVAYFGTALPPSGRSGWVPVLPDYAEGKEGIFINDGTASCTIVSNGGRLMSSIRANGSIDMNSEIDWARPLAKAE